MKFITDAQIETILKTIDALTAERDALALQVLILTNERDEARALGRLA